MTNLLALYTERPTKSTEKAAYFPEFGWIAKSQIKGLLYDKGYARHIVILPDWLATKYATSFDCGRISKEGIAFHGAFISKVNLSKVAL